MKDAMQVHFDRMLAKWAQGRFGLPRVPWEPDVEARMYVSGPDAEEYATWRPLEKTERHDLARIAPDLPPLHPSLHAYFNSWWFCSLEGGFQDYGIILEPVMPGPALDPFLAQVRGYARQRGGRLDHVPIGTEYDGLQVVVDNHTGEVLLEDWEAGTFVHLAPDLRSLVEALRP